MVEFQVLQCSECQTFQVLQVAKSQKWKCKLCGSRQSLIKVYGRGTGADCRKHVQKLNTLRGELDQIKEDASFQLPASSGLISNDNRSNFPGRESSSNWTKYLDSPPDHVCHEEEDYPGVLDGVLVTTDRSLYTAEQKESRKNKRKTRSKEYHYSQHPLYVKRYKEPTGQSSSELTQRKTPTIPSSDVQFRKESGQFSPSHFQNSQPESSTSFVNWSNFQSSTSETIKDESSLNINLEEEKIPLSKERVNHDVKPKMYNKTMSLLNSNEKNITNNPTDVSKYLNVKKNKAIGLSSKSLKASKWDTFLEDDQCENIESNDDTELTPNDYGQLTVLLPNRSSSESFLNL